MKSVNSQVIKINVNGMDTDWFRCQVTNVWADKGYGFAVYRGERLMFHVNQVMAVEAGREGSELRPPTDDDIRNGIKKLPALDSKIIAFVRQDGDGRYHATAWAPFESYTAIKAAMEDTRSHWALQLPKLAPALPKPASAPKLIPVVEQAAEPIVVPVMPRSHDKPRQPRRIPSAASASKPAPTNGSIIPFEHIAPSSEGIDYLSGAVDAARAQAQAQA